MEMILKGEDEMNVGFKCPCGNRKTYAKLRKGWNDVLEVVVFCKECGREIATDVEFLLPYGEKDLITPNKPYEDEWDLRTLKDIEIEEANKI